MTPTCPAAHYPKSKLSKHAGGSWDFPDPTKALWALSSLGCTSWGWPRFIVHLFILVKQRKAKAAAPLPRRSFMGSAIPVASLFSNAFCLFPWEWRWARGLGCHRPVPVAPSGGSRARVSLLATCRDAGCKGTGWRGKGRWEKNMQAKGRFRALSHAGEQLAFPRAEPTLSQAFPAEPSLPCRCFAGHSVAARGCSGDRQMHVSALGSSTGDAFLWDKRCSFNPATCSHHFMPTNFAVTW